MGYIIVEVGTLAFFVGFVALTRYEHNHGTRFFKHTRLTLDNVTERAVFVWKHIKLAKFIRNFVQNVFERAVHDIANVTLRVIQFAEQKLTRVVYTLRARFTNRAEQSSKKTSQFIQTISDFKQELRKDDKTKHDQHII